MSRGDAIMFDMIQSMQDLGVNLSNHNAAADHLLLQNNGITEKLISMKEYNQAMRDVEGCQSASGNRAELVASLQQESRQMQELREDQRLLTHFIDEMLILFDNVMVKHRQVLEDFKRSEKMLQLLEKLQEREYGAQHENADAMAAKLAAFSHTCIEKAVEEGLKNAEIIARLSTENATLRSLLQ